MLKSDLRKKYTVERQKLHDDLIIDGSIEISNRLLRLPIWNFSFYHLYLSIKAKKELDTQPVLSILLGKDKNVVIPKVSKSRNLLHYLLTDDTKLTTNSWGIPEPVNGIEISLDKIEVVFVPLLAFDKKGHRVGYGGGYYDLFLSGCPTDVVKIGLSLFEAEEAISDVEKHDIKLTYAVTPNQTYQF